jgi:lipopolysaccharide heptosyltransferase II
MNTLQILPQLNLGGVETAVFDSVKYLVRMGHKTVVVSAGGELLRDLEALGVVHYQLPVHKKSLFTIIKMISRVAEIIKEEKIELVHAHSRVPAWIAYFATRRTKVVFITTCHGYYKRHPFSQVMGWSKRVIAISNVIARHMVDDFAVPYERIRLIPSSVDLEKFKCAWSPPEKKKNAEFNIGIIGRLTPLKGHLYFIKAMAKVARVLPRIKIWIVGDAPGTREAYKEEIQVLVNRLGLGHCTEFLGNQKDIPAILSHLDVLALATTVPEAFGRVIVEAQACMVPVVATRVGGVVDIIEDTKTGLLVPPADPDGMAAAIIKILKDEALAHNLAEKAYEKVKREYSAELMVKRTLDVYKEALENYKILIIKFSSLGDIILSTAAIRAIRKKFLEGYKISFLIGEASKDLLLNCPYIDELLVCDLKNKDKGIRGLVVLGNILRKKNFDIVIDLQNNRKSRLLAWLTASPDRYGYDNNKWGFLLNHRIRDEKPAMAPVVHQFRILKMLGIELEDSHLELWPTEEDRRYIEEFLSGQWLSANQKLVGINISASPRWVTKSWPLDNLLRLCEELGRRDMRILITGTEKDLTYADTLIKRLKDLKIINACGKTSVNQLACLIKSCAIYVSADSSPLHIAAAMGVPFVALFGPTDSRRHTPPAKDYIVIKKDLPCSPCYKSKCKTKKCMELITAEEVLEAMVKLLK